MCLDHKFSAKAWMKLLQIYAKEGNTQKALLAAVKLTVYHERWYHEVVVSLYKHSKSQIKSFYSLSTYAPIVSNRDFMQPEYLDTKSWIVKDAKYPNLNEFAQTCSEIDDSIF